MLILQKKFPQAWLWLLLLGGAAVIALWSNSPYDVDDAPITYRYAEQLAAGRGFTYNDGEPILGTSTPLYTLILAAIRTIGLPIQPASNVINFISTLTVVWVTMTLTAELSGSLFAGSIAALYLLLQASFVRFTMAGMETPLYTLLIMATFLLTVYQRTRWAAILAGLAFIIRLDGLAVGGALLLGLWLQRRKLPVVESGLYLVTLLPWILFAFWYFGSPIPLSMTAKQHHLAVVGSSQYWIWDHLFLTALGAPTFLLPLTLPGLFVCARYSRQLSHWLVPVLWLLAYLAAYTVVGIDFYEWYLMPVYPLLAIWVGVGISLALKSITVAVAPPCWQPVAIVIAGVVLVLWFLPYEQHMQVSVTNFKAYLQAMESGRVQAGQWLHKQTPPDSKVLAGAIGHVGYQSARYIIDGAGLITPQDRIPLLQPDYMMLDGYVPAQHECGAIKNFAVREGGRWHHTLVSGCRLPAMGNFADLTLANARITHWTLALDGTWQHQSLPYLETQWLIDKPQAASWTLFVHFTNSDGQTLFQADHELGLQVDRSVRNPATWDPGQRIYVYAEMPAEWATGQTQVAALRVGLWQPQTQVALPPTPGYSIVDNSERLVLPVQDGEIQMPVKS